MKRRGGNLKRRVGELNTDRDFGQRVEQRGPYYFLQRRAGPGNSTPIVTSAGA